MTTKLGYNDPYLAEWIYGTEIQLLPQSGSVITIPGENVDTGATVDSGGGQTVEAGGSAISATLTSGGGQFVASGGLAVSTIVGANCILDVGFETTAGGTANDTIVMAAVSGSTLAAPPTSRL
jgi:autotransporter passenger strand-loop-strand repeat protein